MVETMELQKGFKKTEVGIIPTDWKLCSYGELFDFFPTATYSRAQLSENDEIGYVHYGDIHTKCQYFLDCDKTVLPSIKKELQKKYSFLKDGDLIVVDASEDYEGVGKSVEVRNLRKRKVISGLHTFLLRNNDEVIVNGLKGFFHVNRLVKKQMDTLATGLKVYGVSKTNLKKILVPLPPTKVEQTAIATALNDADALITQLEKLIAKKRTIKQGAMQELLKPKEGWQLLNFNQVFKKLNSKHCQIQTKEYKHSGKYPVIDQGKEKIVGFTDDETKLFSCPNEGLIVFGDHTRIIKFVDFDFVIGADGTQLLTVGDNHSLKYFYYQLLLNEVPNTGYNRHYKYLLEMNFRIPEKPKQSLIANILSDLDAEIEALKIKLEKYKMIKQGMMQSLLTGKIRLV